MISGRSVTVMLSRAVLAGLLIGCQAPAKPAPAPPPPARMGDVSLVQSSLQRQDPGARAGLVVRVRNGEHLAAVQLAPQGAGGRGEIKADDLFSITDSAQQPVASGAVVNVDGDIYVLSYVPISGKRAVAEGDIAIHVSPTR